MSVRIKIARRLKRHPKVRAFLLRFWVIIAVFLCCAVVLIFTGSFVGFPWVLEKVGEAIADAGADGIMAGEE
jgi:predicted benzoate:H+ symporter BenE